MKLEINARTKTSYCIADIQENKDFTIHIIDTDKISFIGDIKTHTDTSRRNYYDYGAGNSGYTKKCYYFRIIYFDNGKELLCRSEKKEDLIIKGWDNE